MAQYATSTEFSDQSLPSESLTGISAGTINAALTWASGKINSYLGKRYALPLVSYGEDLKLACCDLAAWYLIKRRGFKTNAGSENAIVKAHDDSIQWLRDVAKGLAEPDAIVDASPELDEMGSLASSDELTSFSFVTARRTSDDDSGCGC